MTRSAQFIPKLFTPPSSLTVWQWAEKHVVLSARVSPRPGPYTTAWCPYVREPQEAFTDPRVRYLVMCWASRTSKTETALNCVRYSIGADAQPVLVVMPNKDLARSFSESRFQPSIEDSAILRAEKPDDPDQFKLLEMHFRRCSVWLTGANSPANLKSRGVGVLMADEIDTWPQGTAKETGALQQAIERIKDRPGAKAILSSTPTLESGQIWYEFGLGDQRYYFVPCPDCGEMQVMRFPQIRWPEECKDNDGKWRLAEVKRLARYHCEKCEAPWLDGQKLKQLTDGQWQVTNKEAEPDRRSYHLSSLYPAWITYGEVAVQFLRAKDNPEELQRVVNSWFAEPFYMGGLKGEFEAQVAARAKEDAPAEVPIDHKAIMTVDVQIDHVRYVVRAHARDRSSVRFEYGQAPGFEEAEVVAKRWGCVIIGVDAAYRPQIVHEWCASRSGWIPVVGSAGLLNPLRWMDIPIDGGLLRGRVVKGLRIRPNEWREELYKRIKAQKGAPTWGILGKVGNDYKKEMVGESRIMRRGTRGQTTIEWVKTGANHYWDCEVNQVALFEATRAFIFDVVHEDPDNKPPGPPARPHPLTSELDEIDAARRGRDGSSELEPITEELWT